MENPQQDIDLIPIPALGYRQLGTILKYGTNAEINYAFQWLKASGRI